MIRPIRQEDAAEIHGILSHPQVARQLDRLPSLTITETINWLEAKPANEHRMVAVQSDRVVGLFNLNQITRARLAHTGLIEIAVHPGSWNMGIGSKLLTSALNLADNWLNLRRIEASVLAENKRAINLVENAGFMLEGVKRYSLFVDGVWRDEIIFSRLLGQERLSAADEQIEQSQAGIKGRQTSDLDVQIRPLHPNDVDDLHDLFSNRATCKTTLQMPSSEWWLTETKVNTHNPGLHRFVAVVDGRVNGAISLNQNPRPGRTHSARIGMSIAPDYWNMGIGSLLMEAVIDIADNWLALKRIELDVNIDNLSAVHLYKRFNFKVEGTKRLHAFGDGRWKDSYVMSRIEAI